MVLTDSSLDAGDAPHLHAPLLLAAYGLRYPTQVIWVEENFTKRKKKKNAEVVYLRSTSV